MITRNPRTKITSADDVQTKWENFQDTITTPFHHFLPAETLMMHPRDVPWVIPHIKPLMQQRTKACYTDTDLYRRPRHQVIKEVKSAEQTCYPKRVHSLKETNYT